MTLAYTIRPISDRTQFAGPALFGNRNPFDAQWSSTLELLERELGYLEAAHVVLELDVREQDLRIDGTLRSNARTETSPAVRLAFDSTHGPLVYATDRYGWSTDDQPYVQGWQQNVRAIALGLEALRRVDRYGITRRAEQYRGFKAIGGAVAMPGSTPGAMSADEALRIVSFAVGHGQQVGRAAVDSGDLPRLVRIARANTHPDRHSGDRTHSDRVDRAVQALEAAGLLS